MPPNSSGRNEEKLLGWSEKSRILIRRVTARLRQIPLGCWMQLSGREKRVVYPGMRGEGEPLLKGSGIPLAAGKMLHFS